MDASKKEEIGKLRKRVEELQEKHLKEDPFVLKRKYLFEEDITIV